MTEHSETVAATRGEHVSFANPARGTSANERAAAFVVGTQKLVLEELIFAGTAFVERLQSEIHLCSEFVSKAAGAHSVKDIGTMYEECSKHQLDFVRRDCDRMFRHGEQLIEASSNLFRNRPLN